MNRLTLGLLALLAHGLFAKVVHAAPLVASDLDLLDQYLTLEGGCLELPAYERAQCRTAMTNAIGTSSPAAIWEKDGVAGISRADQHLALAEYWDEGSLQYICYQDPPTNKIVNFAENCGPAACIANRQVPCQETCAADANAPESCVSQCAEAACADADHDGLFVYQEASLGLLDSHADTCTSGADCGFGARCEYLQGEHPFHVRPVCQARTCPDGRCTAFHLQTVSQDANEVIVQVYFDYAPVPVTVLDLYLSFDAKTLALIDTRPLPVLAAAGQKLEARQPTDGELRLVVLGTDSKRPIETGAIAELVFLRRTGAAAQISFSSSDNRRELSVAPSPGTTALKELRRGELWGDPVSIPAASSSSGRLLLYYSFDNSQHPLDQNLAKQGEDLCPSSLQQSCLAQLDTNTAPPSTELGRRALQSRMNSLQRGTVETNSTVAGVVGGAAFLDGYGNHLELPLTFREPNQEQDFSFGTWFFSESDARTAASTQQVLFSHNTPFEKTQYAVVLVPDAQTGRFGLDWVEGNLTEAPKLRRPIARGLSHGAWRHLAVTVDAASQRSEQAGTVRFLLDGAGCGPGQARIEVKTQLSGAFDLSGERLQTACVERGTASQAWNLQLNRSGSPYVLRAWVESSGHLQLRVIQGEAEIASAEGLPAGTAEVVWEGNTQHFQVRVLSESVSAALYLPLLVRPSCPAFAADVLKLHEMGNITGGRVPEAVLFASSRSNLFGIERADLNGLSHQTLVRTGDSSSRDGHYHTGKRKLVYASNQSGSYEIWTANADGTQPVQITKGFGDASREIVARRPRWAPDGSAIVFESNVYDLARGDNAVSRAFHLYYVAYDTTTDQVAVPIPGGSAATQLDYGQLLGMQILGDYRLTKGTSHHFGSRWLRGRFQENGQSYLGELLLTTASESRTTRGIASIKISTLINETVTTPLSPFGASLPSTAALELLAAWNPQNDATPRRKLLQRVDSSTVGTPPRRVLQERLFLQDGEETPVELKVDGLEQVFAADFAPSGDQLVLSGIIQSRPVLVATSTLGSIPSAGTLTLAAGVLSEHPTKIEGVQWMKLEQLYACNWLGGQRGRTTGDFTFGFRGGFDELKVYDYVRAEDAFRSEAARGLDRLAIAGGNAPSSGTTHTCGSDLDCPAYQLCDGSTCKVTTCSSTEPCARGKCTLRPVPNGGREPVRVCSVECVVEGQCFTQQCLNGPCRYCEAATNSCQECRTVTDAAVAGVTTPTTHIEGCPDRNSFSCQQGSCVTECYSFDNDQSTYLCAPGLEYCQAGRCVGFAWSWNDLSPMTLMGAGEMSLRPLKRTIAVSQIYPIEIVAFGSEDYGVSPEIIVEGRDGSTEVPLRSGAWFELGRVQVHHRTPEAASQSPYTLQTPYPITQIRVRLNTASYQSGTYSASRAPGSKAFLGYRAEVSRLEQIAACQGKPGCPAVSRDPRLRYLLSGQPTVIIDRLDVKGNSVMGPQLESNLACRYEGTDAVDDSEPIGLGNRVRSVSVPATRQPPLPPLSPLYERKANSALQAWGLLNCAWTDPSTSPARLAGLVGNVPGGTFPVLGTGVLREGNIIETAQCVVEVDATRTEPCFEWVGAGVSFDPYGDAPQANRTLDYSDYRSFGYTAGDP